MQQKTNGINLMCSRIISHFFQPFFIILIRLSSQNERHFKGLCYLKRTRKHKFPTSFDHPRVWVRSCQPWHHTLETWTYLLQTNLEETKPSRQFVPNLGLCRPKFCHNPNFVLFFFGSESLILFAFKVRRAYEGNDLNIA